MRRGLAEVGSLPPHAVWERYASPSRWSTWSPQIRWVECQPDRLQVGLTGTVHGLFGVRAHFEVLSVDQVRRTWSWRAWTGPVALLLHHAVLDGPGGGSEATLEVDGPALAVLVYAPLADVALRRLVRP